jgi:hypothetical protein
VLFHVRGDQSLVLGMGATEFIQMLDLPDGDLLGEQLGNLGEYAGGNIPDAL